MKAYRIKENGNGIEQADKTPPSPGPGEVRISVKAAALNYRDLMVADGQYGPADFTDVVPLSDGAGEIQEVGPGVADFRPGDRILEINGEPFRFWSDLESYVTFEEGVSSSFKRATTGASRVPSTITPPSASSVSTMVSIGSEAFRRTSPAVIPSPPCATRRPLPRVPDGQAILHDGPADAPPAVGRRRRSTRSAGTLRWR